MSSGFQRTTELGVYTAPSLNNLGVRKTPKVTYMHTLCPLAGQSLPGPQTPVNRRVCLAWLFPKPPLSLTPYEN